MEYEIGKVYYASDGKPYRYMGGDPNDRSNWQSTDAPAPKPKASNRFGDVARLLAQGATLGFADEIGELVDGPEAAAADRARLARLREEMPVGSMVAEGIGGALVPGLGAARTARAVMGATGSRVFGGIAGGAAGGLLGGAAVGAGEAEPGSRISGGLLGGGLGAVTGATAGGAGAAGGRALTRMTGAVGDAREWAGVQIRQALEEAGVDPSQIVARLREMGEGSVVADIGQNLARKARAAINQAPGLAVEGGPVDALQRRNAATGERLAGELRDASGLPGTYRASLQAARKGVQDVRREWYKPLEQLYPQVDGKNVAATLADPRVAAVARKVATEVAEGQRAPSFRELQDIMMELRDDMTAAQRAGRPNASQQAGEVYDALVNAMRQDVPEFGPAQVQYRIAVQTRDAHALGRKMATKPVSDIMEEMEKLPIGARDAYRQGILDRFETQLRERTGTGAAGKVIDAGPEMQERLRVLMGSDEGFEKLMQARDREWRWRRTWAALAGNSTSAQQLSDMFTPDRVPVGKWDALQKAAAWVVGMSPKERQEAWELIGKTLMSEGEEAARLLAEEMAQRRSWSAVAGAVGGTTVAGEASK